MNYLAPLLVLPALLFQCGASGSGSVTSSAPVPVHPGPAKHVVLRQGEERIFGPGVLRPGDTVSCVLDGRPLHLRIPHGQAFSGFAIGMGAATQSGSTGELQAKSNPDGTIAASCGAKTS